LKTVNCFEVLNDGLPFPKVEKEPGIRVAVRETRKHRIGVWNGSTVFVEYKIL
jgi:hypothetical protein